MTKHVIIGGGPVATNAIETIRQYGGGEDTITLISDEPAHSRMALPYWLSGKVPREHTHTADDAEFARLAVDARIGSRATAIDPGGRTVTLCDDSTVEYDNLLIATGSSPAGLPVPGIDLPGVQPLWTLEHTASLLAAAEGNDAPRVTMIGAGFIGFIMLNAMHKKGWNLAVVERESHVLPRMLDGTGAGLVESWLASKGVAVHAGASVESITEGEDGSRVVNLAGGGAIESDVVIVATGIRPNTDLATAAGIETDQGILVNARCQTNVEGIYAGGDVAQGPVLGGGANEIHSIQPTAVDHGRIAGANMAGHNAEYGGSLSLNILDVCGLQNASFGDWGDASDDNVTVVNAADHIYRKFIFTGDQMTGAVFVGEANDLGMLTDVGMIKGIMQTRSSLGAWKDYLKNNPFDVRRAYIANGVAAQLAKTTLLGQKAQPRGYHFGGQSPTSGVDGSHSQLVSPKAAAMQKAAEVAAAMAAEAAAESEAGGEAGE